MSAKKAPTEKPAKGYKACPSCGGIIAARSMNCKHCGFELTPKAKSATTPRGKRSTSAGQTENPQITLLRELKVKGYDVKITVDALDDSAEPVTTFEKTLNPLMEFVPSYTSNHKFELSLDQLLTVLKLPLKKN